MRMKILVLTVAALALVAAVVVDARNIVKRQESGTASAGIIGSAIQFFLKKVGECDELHESYRSSPTVVYCKS